MTRGKPENFGFLRGIFGVFPFIYCDMGIADMIRDQISQSESQRCL